jgi:AcrR family transcriptional regulator
VSEQVCDDEIGEEPPSRREQLKREREGQILDAAAAVFAEKGFHQATVHDIATRAGVADGTLYNYFENKFDLLIAILAQMAELEQLPGELLQALQGEPKDFFVAAFRERMGRIDAGQEMFKAVLPQVFVNPELREQFYRQYVLRIAHLLEGFVQGQIDAGRLRLVDARLLTRLVQATFVGVLVLRILGDETVQARWAELPEVWAGILFDGLKPREEG